MKRFLWWLIGGSFAGGVVLIMISAYLKAKYSDPALVPDDVKFLGGIIFCSVPAVVIVAYEKIVGEISRLREVAFVTALFAGSVLVAALINLSG